MEFWEMWPPEEHERLIENMSAWMDGELPDIASTPEAGGPDDLELEVAEHQACCPSCRDLFEELKELRAGFETLPEPDPPEGFAQSVLDRIRAEARPKVIPLFKRPQVRALAGLAACLVLVAGLYGVSRRQEQDKWTLTARSFNRDVVEEFSDISAQESLPGEGIGPRVNAALPGLDDEPQVAAHTAPEPGVEKAAPSQSYAFQNDQYIRVGDSMEPGARIIGNVSSLENFLAQFEWSDFSEVQAQYNEEYFEAGRLLAVTMTEPSGSIRHRISQLTLDRVTVERIIPEATTCDVGAWLILAEVGTDFNDGGQLELTAVPCFETTGDWGYSEVALTLERMPEGGWELIPPETPVSPEGLYVTAGLMEQLAQLAREQGIDASLTLGSETSNHCLVVILDEPE